MGRATTERERDSKRDSSPLEVWTELLEGVTLVRFGGRGGINWAKTVQCYLGRKNGKRIGWW